MLVIGLGRMGHALVEELWDTNVELLVLDRNPAAIEVVKDKTSAAFVADGSDPRTLEDIAHAISTSLVTFARTSNAPCSRSPSWRSSKCR